MKNSRQRLAARLAELVSGQSGVWLAVISLALGGWGPAAVAEARAGALLLRGSFSLKQSAYGMKPYAKFGGMVGVADELKIWGDVWLPAGTAPSLQPRVSAP